MTVTATEAVRRAHLLLQRQGEAGFPQLTTKDLVAAHLRRSILQGTLAPGARVLQAAVASEVGVSTTPVREAIRELAGEGLLDIDAYKGVVVHSPNRAELEEVLRYRMLLEPIAIEAAVDLISEDEISLARQVLTAMENSDDAADWVVLNEAFHALILSASRLPTLTPILLKLRNTWAIYVAALLREKPVRRKEADREHRALLDACAGGNKELAIKLLVDHSRPTLGLSAD